MHTKQPKPIDSNKSDVRPDGWDRFRVAVHAAAKSGPKHRTKEPAAKQANAKGPRA